MVDCIKMNYNYSISTMKNINTQLTKYNEFLSLHQEKVKHHKTETLRIPINTKIKCSFGKCPKQASYSLNNTSYCWFHRIDINLKHNLTL